MKMTEEKRKRPALFQSLFTAVFSNETITKRMSAGLSLDSQVIGELIALRQQCGEIRSDIAPDAVGQYFHRMIFGSMLIWSLSPDTPLEENLKKMTDVFIHGIQSGQQRSVPEAAKQ